MKAEPATKAFAASNGVTYNDGYAIDGDTANINSASLGGNSNLNSARISGYTYTDATTTSYTATVTAGDPSGTNPMYTLTATSQAWTITRKVITMSTWGTKTKVYDKSVAYAGFTQPSGFIEGDDVTAVAAYDNANVGEGKIITASFSGAKAGNYVFDATGTVTDGVITRKSITVTAYESNGSTPYTGQISFTFNGAAQTGIVLTATGVISGDTVTVVVTGGEHISVSGSATSASVSYSGTNAATYSYSVAAGTSALSGTNAGNYTIASAVSASFKINAKSIALTWSATNTTGGTTPNFTKTYNGTTSTMSADWTKGLTAGSASAGAYTSDPLTLSVTAGAYTTSSANVGTYSVTVASSNSNYTVTNPTAQVTVNAKTLAIASTNSWSRVYDGTTNYKAYTVGGANGSFTGNNGSFGTGVGSETIVVTAIYDSKNVSDATKVTFSKADGTNGGKASNYAFSGLSNTTYNTASITAKALTFTITADTPYTYSGSVQGATVTLVSGLVGSEKIHISMKNPSGKAAWTNYALAANAERTTTGDGWTNGTSCMYGGANVGDYGITLLSLEDTASGLASNYSLSGTTSLTWSIVARKLYVTWTSGSYTYNKANQGITWTIGNLAGSEVPSVTLTNTGTATWASPAAKSSGQDYTVAATTGTVAGLNQGSYGAEVKSFASNGAFIATNYTWDTNYSSKDYSQAANRRGTFTIARKNVTVVWTATDSAAATPDVDATAPEFTATYNGNVWTLTATATAGAEVAGDGKVYTGDSVTFAYSGANTFTNAGDHTVTASLSGNYVVNANAAGTLHISRRTIGIAWAYTSGVTNTNEFVYDKSAHGVILTASNVVSGDSVTIPVTHTGFTGSDLTITSGTSGSADYTATTVKYSSGVQSYEASVAAGDIGTNYVIAANSSSTFLIIPKGITVTAVASKVYDGTTAVAASALTFATLATGDSASDLGASAVYYHATASQAPNAGEGKTVRVTINNHNYSLNNTNGGTVQQQDFALGTITAKSIATSWSVSGTSTGSSPNFTTIYDGNTRTFTPSWTSEAAGAGNSTDGKAYSVSTPTYTVSTGALTTSSKNVGTYTVTITSSNNNYTFTNATAQVTIGKKTISFTAAEFAHLTDDTSNGFTFARYYGSASGPATAAGFISLGDHVWQGLVFAVSGVCTGDTIVLSKTGDGRSIFKPTTPRDVANENAYVYDEDEEMGSGASYTFNYEDGDVLFAGETHDYNTSSSSLIYLALAATGGDNGNYTLAQQSFGWNMNRKTVSSYDWALSGDDNSDLSVVYDGIAHTMTATPHTATYSTITAADGYVLSGDEIAATSYTGTRSATAKDDYSVNVATAAYTGKTGVYAFAPQASDQAWHITPLTVTITWGTKIKEYDGNATYNGFTASGILPGDAANVTVSAAYQGSGAKNVGTGKSLEASLSGTKSGNYTISNPTATGGAITEKTLTVGFTNVNAEWTYDRAAHGTTVTISGVVSGDSVTVNVTKPDGTSATIAIANPAESNSATYTVVAADDYTVSVVSLAASGDYANYQLPTSGTSTAFTINPKTIALTWSATGGTIGGTAPAFTKTYDGATSTLTPSWTGKGTGNGLVDGSSAAGTYENDVLTLSANSYTTTSANAGTYNVTVTSTNTNYVVTGGSASMTIGKAQITFTAMISGQSYVYNGQSSDFRNMAQYKVTGLVGEETLIFRNTANRTGTYQTGFAYEMTNTTIVSGKYSAAYSGRDNNLTATRSPSVP